MWNLEQNYTNKKIKNSLSGHPNWNWTQISAISESMAHQRQVGLGFSKTTPSQLPSLIDLKGLIHLIVTLKQPLNKLFIRIKVYLIHMFEKLKISFTRQPHNEIKY